MKPAVADVVKAKRFEVVDAAGKVQAVFGLGTDGTVGVALVLYDAAGKIRATLAMLYGNPVLGLHDAAGKMRATMIVAPDGNPALVLHDAAGKVIWEAP